MKFSLSLSSLRKRIAGLCLTALFAFSAVPVVAVAPHARQRPAAAAPKQQNTSKPQSAQDRAKAERRKRIIKVALILGGTIFVSFLFYQGVKAAQAERERNEEWERQREEQRQENDQYEKAQRDGHNGGAGNGGAGNGGAGNGGEEDWWERYYREERERQEREQRKRREREERERRESDQWWEKFERQHRERDRQERERREREERERRQRGQQRGSGWGAGAGSRGAGAGAGAGRAGAGFGAQRNETPEQRQAREERERFEQQERKNKQWEDHAKTFGLGNPGAYARQQREAEWDREADARGMDHEAYRRERYDEYAEQERARDRARMDAENKRQAEENARERARQQRENERYRQENAGGGLPPDVRGAYAYFKVPPGMSFDDAYNHCHGRFKKSHPDQGGSSEEFRAAREQWKRMQEHKKRMGL